MLTVPRPTEAVIHLIASTVIFREWDAMEESTIHSFRTLTMCKVNTEELVVSVAGIIRVGFGESGISLQHASIGGRLSVCLVAHVSNEATVPYVVLIVALCVVPLGVDEGLLLAGSSAEELLVFTVVYLSSIGSRLTSPKPT